MSSDTARSAQTAPSGGALTEDPEAARLLRAPVQGWDMRTLALLAGCLGVWLLGLWLMGQLPLLGGALVVLALALHSSLSHEILHGAPCPDARWGNALGLFQPGLAIPYLRFKRLHLAHHKDARLTDPYDDPETNYLDPAVWAGLARWQKTLLRANNTLAGRMLLGPALGQWQFMRDDLRQIAKGAPRVLSDWLLHLPGVALTLWIVSAFGLSLTAYLLACYGALSVLKIRTFLEHRAHEASAARTVIIEDRGPLAFLFLNNNYHVVHHMHPTVPWYRLPALYRAQRARYLACNDGYVYRSYGQIFARFLWRSKDPVAHPLWEPGGR